jgi:predicted ribosome quality control (RQC) complex YloA/Tae2 family protein
MQRKLTSFDIYVIVSELKELKENFIEKIYQLNRNDFLIRVKNNKTKQKQNLFIRNGELICISDRQFDTPLKPSIFAMTLRKYLLNGKIVDISQYEFDRIIKLKISRKEGEYSLIIEFFSEGNIILVNPKGEIILPLIKQRWAHRSIKGREPYLPPPVQINPFHLTKERFIELINESKADLVRTLAVNVNLSGVIAEEICKISDVDKSLNIKDIDNEKIDRIFNSLTNFLKLFKNDKFEPVLVKRNEEVADILPFEFKSYEKAGFEKISKFTKGLENFIDYKKPIAKKVTDIEKKISKLDRQLQQQKQTTIKLKKEIEQKKLEGDLIYLNYQPLEELLKKISEILEMKDKESMISEINENEIVKKFNPTEKLLIVNLKDTSGKIFEIKINFRKTVADNAEAAYDYNKKLRNKLKGAEKSIKKTKEQIEEIKKIKQAEKKVEKIDVKKERIFWFERFRWFISSDGNIVVGGKDAKTNELVVKKYLKKGDRYAHADIQGAPSIIVKSNGIKSEPLQISNETLEEACIFAASYSKAWKQFAEAQSYWVLPEQVSKTAQTGEFVPRGAFIIRGKRNYQRCKLEIAVGEITIDDERKIMAGPISSVKKRTDKYVVLEPGAIKKSEISKKLAKAFNVNVDKIDRILPSGGVTVIESFGVLV